MKVTIEVPPELVERLRRAETAIRANVDASYPMVFSATQQTAAMAALLVLDALPVSPKIGQRVCSMASRDYPGEVLFVHEPSQSCLVLHDDDSYPMVVAFGQLAVLG